jgi:ATP-dependent DNA ligase
LAGIPINGILDGELVVFGDEGRPDFPALGRRILHGERSIPVKFVAFDPSSSTAPAKHGPPHLGGK